MSKHGVRNEEARNSYREENTIETKVIKRRPRKEERERSAGRRVEAV